MNKIALITGANKGIGLETARQLGRKQITVLVGARDLAKGKKAAEELKKEGIDARALEIDVSKAESIQRAAADVKKEFGHLDILINNAGITRDASFKKLDKVNWDAVIRTNLDSVFNMTKPLCEGMMERGWGRIINVSSIIGSKGGFGQANYAAAKAGMHGFTKSLALEVAKKGVTVNTISPGFIATKMVTALPQDVLDTRIIPQIPVGRLGKPEEVAGLIIYLASEEAAFLTGANIAINGGQHMQ